jgi:hypothetical protein
VGVLKVAGIVLILLTPTLAGAALIGIVRLSRESSRRLRIRRSGATAGRPPLEQIAADLRRLHREVARLEDTPDTSPGRHVRLRAVRYAYGDSLLVACRALEVPVATADITRAPAGEIYRLESALRDRGLDVYPTALR